MPLGRIDLIKGRGEREVAAIGVKRTDGIVFIQGVLSKGRTTEQKQAFYALVARLLAEKAAVRPEDVAISIVESTREDWSFGNGVAQYLVLPKE